MLLRKEIKNGFITNEIWDALTKLCTAQEFKEIKNFNVISAIYWLDSDRVNSVEELANEFLKDRGEYSFDSNLNTLVDTRTYKW